ncbi:MAG: electron transfer flavoprotein subunit beta/FixA family protein, partial [Limnochordia bacterium]
GILIRDGVKMIFNPYDYPALEAALQLKEASQGEVIALTMGPPLAEEVLREAVSLGADDGILLSDPAFAGADTLATAYTLARGIETLGDVDLILCGSQSVDGETGHVGAQIATWLGLVHVEEGAGLALTEGVVQVWHRTGYGRELLAVEPPLVVSLAKDAYEPRLPSLRNKMRAKKHPFRHWGKDDISADPECIGVAGSPTKIHRTFVPPGGVKGQIFSGSAAEQVAQLWDQLERTGVLAACRRGGGQHG